MFRDMNTCADVHICDRILNMKDIALTSLIDTFKLFSDSTRMKILQVLMNSKIELCVHEIAEATNTSQSATSHQLAKLEARGLVSCTRKGQTMCYRIEEGDQINRLKKTLAIFNL